MLVAKGKPAEAVSLLEDVARTTPLLAPNVAGILEDLGQFNPAENLLRSLAAKPTVATPQGRANATLALIGFLGRRDRHGEAIDLCEKLWADPSVPPSRVSSAAVIVLYSGRPSAGEFKRVEAGITEALKKAPSDVVLRFDAANLDILQGDYAEAEAFFRDLHKAKPDLGAPLNNLAWLLALRGVKGPEPLDLIDEAIAKEGATPDLLDTRGLILTLIGEPEKAIDDLEESLAASPTPSGYVHLAHALKKAGKVAEAAEAFKKARTSGLRPGEIHPLEQPTYRELLAAFPEAK